MAQRKNDQPGLQKQAMGCQRAVGSTLYLIAFMQLFALFMISCMQLLAIHIMATPCFSFPCNMAYKMHLYFADHSYLVRLVAIIMADCFW